MHAQHANLQQFASEGDVYDCLVIGGGPAGLSAATVLARHAMRTIVFDGPPDLYPIRTSGSPEACVGSLTWDSLKHNLSSRQTMGLVAFEATAISKIEQDGQGHFIVANSSSCTWRGRRVILATGVSELLPDIPGFDECWAQGVYPPGTSHQTPYNTEDGSEKFQSVGILALNEQATVDRVTTLTLLAHRTAETVIVYTDGDEEMADELREHQSLATISSSGSVLVDSRPLLKLKRQGSRSSKVNGSVEIQFVDCSSIANDYLIHEAKTQPNGPFVHQLGLDLTEKGSIRVAPVSQATNVDGVFAVGDCASSIKTMFQAVSLGALGGEAVSVELAKTA